MCSCCTNTTYINFAPINFLLWGISSRKKPHLVPGIIKLLPWLVAAIVDLWRQNFNFCDDLFFNLNSFLTISEDALQWGSRWTCRPLPQDPEHLGPAPLLQLRSHHQRHGNHLPQDGPQQSRIGQYLWHPCTILSIFKSKFFCSAIWSPGIS